MKCYKTIKCTICVQLLFCLHFESVVLIVCTKYLVLIIFFFSNMTSSQKNVPRPKTNRNRVRSVEFRSKPKLMFGNVGVVEISSVFKGFHSNIVCPDVCPGYFSTTAKRTGINLVHSKSGRARRRDFF